VFRWVCVFRECVLERWRGRLSAGAINQEVEDLGEQDTGLPTSVQCSCATPPHSATVKHKQQHPPSHNIHKSLT